MGRHNMFMKFTGDRSGLVRGEADEPAHQGEIQVSDWGWGMTSPTAVGSGMPTGRVRFDTLYVVKEADTATTALMNVMNGNELGTAELSVRKAGGEAFDYLVIKLQKARIVSYKIDSTVGPEGAPMVGERVEMTFKTIEIEHRDQDPTGGAAGGSVFVGDAFPEG